MMKYAVWFCLVVGLTGKHFNLNFYEDGHKFKEGIEINEKKNTIIYNVPKHGNIKAAKFLKDFNNRLTVMKDDDQKVCFVSKMQASEPKPRSLVEGLKQTKGDFPKQSYIVHKRNMLPIQKSDPRALPSAVFEFCANYTKLDAGFYTEKEMEDIALKELSRIFSRTKTKRQSPRFPQPPLPPLHLLPPPLYLLLLPPRLPPVGIKTNSTDIWCTDITRSYCTFPKASRKSFGSMSFLCSKCEKVYKGKLVTRCKKFHNPRCTYTVPCNIDDNGIYRCHGVHTFTQNYCCSIDCVENIKV